MNKSVDHHTYFWAFQLMEHTLVLKELARTQMDKLHIYP